MTEIWRIHVPGPMISTPRPADGGQEFVAWRRTSARVRVPVVAKPIVMGSRFDRRQVTSLAGVLPVARVGSTSANTNVSAAPPSPLSTSVSHCSIQSTTLMSAGD